MSTLLKDRAIRLSLTFSLLILSSVAEAYIGPGAGISFLQGIWVALVGVIITIIAIAILPLKLLVRHFGLLKVCLASIGLGIVISFFYITIPQSIPAKVTGRILVLGFDGMDPVLTQRWMDEGLMPNFEALARNGNSQTLETSNPAQSPVAWSSFATGTGPGEHGIFDFLRRSTNSYEPDFSISETTPTEHYLDLFGVKIPIDGGEIINRRIGEPFWMAAEKMGLNAAVLRVPVSYPPDPIHQMLSGMGVPDLLGTQGTYSIYTTERMAASGNRRINRVRPDKKGKIETAIFGPANPFFPEEILTQTFTIEPTLSGVLVNVNDNKVDLKEGQWSDWQNIHFDMAGHLSTQGMVRFLLLQRYPKLKLYVSPIHIDPFDPAVPISSPPEFAAKLAEKIGLFHTIGMPEETWSLNENQIDDEAYLAMIRSTLAEREAMWYSTLDEHNAELAVAVFVQTDRVSHMFYRGLDKEHALHNETDENARGAIQWIYQEADRILGETLKRMDKKDNLIVLSDHGFAPFRSVIHLNRWLADAGYLIFKDPETESEALFEGVDWSRTKAYALGLNGVYINQIGREPEGSVSRLDTKALKIEIADLLRELKDPEGGNSLIKEVYYSEDIYPGLAIAEAPDLVIGYEKNYRASWQTTLGGTPNKLVEENLQKWSGDHCIDPSLVPGILFTTFPLSQKLTKIQDVPGLVLSLLKNLPQEIPTDG